MNERLVSIARTARSRAELLKLSVGSPDKRMIVSTLADRFAELEKLADQGAADDGIIRKELVPCVHDLRHLEDEFARIQES